MSDSGDVTPGELSRRMREVLSRFESLVKQVEERYVRKDILDLYEKTIDAAVKGAQDRISAIDSEKLDKSEYVALEKRVIELEDNNKWLFRLVIGFIIVAILGAVFATGGGVGK